MWIVSALSVWINTQMKRKVLRTCCHPAELPLLLISLRLPCECVCAGLYVHIHPVCVCVRPDCVLAELRVFQTCASTLKESICNLSKWLLWQFKQKGSLDLFLMPQHMQATHSHSKLLMVAKCHRPQVSNEVGGSRGGCRNINGDWWRDKLD